MVENNLKSSSKWKRKAISGGVLIASLFVRLLMAHFVNRLDDSSACLDYQIPSDSHSFSWFYHILMEAWHASEFSHRYQPSKKGFTGKKLDTGSRGIFTHSKREHFPWFPRIMTKQTFIDFAGFVKCRIIKVEAQESVTEKSFIQLHGTEGRRRKENGSNIWQHKCHICVIYWMYNLQIYDSFSKCVNLNTCLACYMKQIMAFTCIGFHARCAGEVFQ